MMFMLFLLFVDLHVWICYCFHGLRKPHILPASGDAWNHNGSTSVANRNWESKSMSISKSASEAYIIYHRSNLYNSIYIYIMYHVFIYIYIQIYREIDRYVNDVCVCLFFLIYVSVC